MVSVTSNQEQPAENTTYISFSGYVFIDKDVAGVLANSFRIDIENGFNLQKILFLESGILVAALLLGIVLFLVSAKKAIGLVNGETDFIPIDIKLGIMMTSLALWIFLYGTYLSTIASYFKLFRRVIWYVVFVLLTFILLSFFIMLILKTKQYRADRFRFFREWENRLTKKIPSWIIGFVLQFCWYFFILTAISPASTVYAHLVVIKNKWALIIVHNVLIFLVFVLISKIQKGKEVYREEVLSKAQEIANGNLDQNVPVAGNDFYAQMAKHINTIKAGYIQALHEQKKK